MSLIQCIDANELELTHVYYEKLEEICKSWLRANNQDSIPYMLMRRINIKKRMIQKLP